MVVMSRETEDENTAAAVLFALQLIFRVPKISPTARTCGDTDSHPSGPTRVRAAA